MKELPNDLQRGLRNLVMVKDLRMDLLREKQKDYLKET